jgi:MoxR-like ATPase
MAKTLEHRTGSGVVRKDGLVGEGVFLVIGVQGAGKTTVADLLARPFDRGVHVRGGQFYRWARTGWIHHDGPRVVEARRHLDLHYRLSAMVADEYCAQGFTTVVPDSIYGDDAADWLRRVMARPRHLVVLRPRPDVVRRRAEQRWRDSGKVAYREGGDTVDSLDAALAATPRVGLWLDTSDQTPEVSVAEIVRRRSEAVVD